MLESRSITLREDGAQLVRPVEGWPAGTRGTIVEPYLFTAAFSPMGHPDVLFTVSAEDVENAIVI